MDIMSMLDPTTSVSSAAASRVASGLAAARTSAASATTTGTGTSSAASQGITSSDFLSLLVTEMKNQDPTQPTDPNAYIQQLVGVNSLQQLISINQELGSSSTGSAGSTGSAAGSTPAVTGS